MKRNGVWADDMSNPNQGAPEPNVPQSVQPKQIALTGWQPGQLGESPTSSTPPPQYPHFPPPQYQATQAFRRVHAPARRSTNDIILTSVISVVAIVVALGSLCFSVLMLLGAASCGDNPASCDNFRADMEGWASYLIAGGVAIAGILGVSGIIVAAVRRSVMWIWPTLASGLNIIAVVIGVYLAWYFG